MDWEVELLQNAVEPLIGWFEREKRDLPWRHTRDPYAIWVSEIMLQQTRVEAVKGYYARFLAAFPTVESLAEADDERLLKAWEGLGYYSRARNLRAAARTVVEEYGGHLPPSREKLRALKGIGDYTAGSISSIAFGLPEPAVDGNVLRVLTRLLKCDKNIDRPQTKAEFAALLKHVYRPEYASALTESLMELGALVCLPNGEPRCAACPLRPLCRAHDHPEDYPVRDAKKARRVEQKTMLVLETPNGLYLQKREKGLLKSLWQFPLYDNFLSDAEIAARANELGFDGEICLIAEGRHVFTHVEWQIKVYYGKGAGCGAVAWEDLARYPFPSAISQFFGAIENARKQ